MRLAHKSLDDLVAAGCTWDQAEELMRFPILKFLTASPEQLDAGMPVLETLAYHLDRRMSEQQARAVLHALPTKFAVDQKQQWGGKGLREDWLASQHRLFDEMREARSPSPQPSSYPYPYP